MISPAAILPQGGIFGGVGGLLGQEQNMRVAVLGDSWVASFLDRGDGVYRLGTPFPDGLQEALDPAVEVVPIGFPGSTAWGLGALVQEYSLNELAQLAVACGSAYDIYGRMWSAEDMLEYYGSMEAILNTYAVPPITSGQRAEFDLCIVCVGYNDLANDWCTVAATVQALAD